MADNTVLLPGAGGDTLRDVDKGGAKTQVVLLDVGGIGAETLFTGAVSVSNFPATQPISGSVGVSNFPASQAVTGAFFQATQPVSGTFFQATQPVSGTVTTSPPANASTNVAQLSGTATSVNSGVKDAGTLRVVLATDQPVLTNKLLVTPDSVALPANQSVNVNQFAGTGAQTGSGTATGALRVELANNGTGLIATVSAVTAITNALPAGTNLLGKVGIDQTTPGTTNLVAQAGIKTNNNAAPGVNNEGSLTALGNAAIPAWTEGNLVLQSSDLAGGQRVVSRPMVILGAYRLAAQTAVYAGLLAGAILYSFRWTDATKNCRVTRVRVAVNTITAAGAAGMLDRDLVIVRGFTVADSGGTAITLTGNNQKARTSHATTVVGGIQILSGGALTAGTGTADAQAIGLVTKQGLAAEPPGLTIPPEDLFAYNVGQNYPIVLAANEGFRVRIPTAMPTTIAQRTTVTVEWDEIATATAF